MSKTDMAPAPINLFTSWISYFAKLCKKGWQYHSESDTTGQSFYSVARKSKVEGYPKFSTNQSSGNKSAVKNPGLFVPEVGATEREMSQTSVRDSNTIENVIDWKIVIKKYFALIR